MQYGEKGVWSAEVGVKKGKKKEKEELGSRRF